MAHQHQQSMLKKTNKPNSPSSQSLPPIRFSLRLKLVLGLVMFVAVALASTNIVGLLRRQKQQRADAWHYAKLLAQLSSVALLDKLPTQEIDDPEIIRTANNAFGAAAKINRKSQGFVYAALVTPANKRIAAHINADAYNALLPKELKSKTLPTLSDLENFINKPNSKIFRHFRYPIFVGENKKGSIEVGISTLILEKNLHRDLWVNLVVLFIITLAVAIYTYAVLRFLVLAPVEKVSDAMLRIEAGDLEWDLKHKSHDEMGRLTKAYTMMRKGLKEQRIVKDAFSRYLSAELYETIKDTKIGLNGELRHATVLFADIRGFTTFSEGKHPQELVAELNTYFGAMVEVIMQNGGFVNKFIGDAIMAVFGAPLLTKDPELKATRCALEMLESLQKLNEQRKSEGKPPFEIGIGISSGTLLAGNIGHPKRLEYTVMGDTVNVAQRIESHTKVAGYPILICEETYQRVKTQFSGQSIPGTQLKGRTQLTRLFAPSHRIVS